MCGRTAQSRQSIQLAATGIFKSAQVDVASVKDSCNKSPGTEFAIFKKQSTNHVDNGVTTNGDPNICNPIICTSHVWGIIPRSGSKEIPLPEGPSKHFSNLMFNARSDTLYDKRTFRDLVLQGNTCICAIDGFFEWKESGKDALSTKGKQPYYVHRSDGIPILVAGLWKTVQTGRVTKEGGKETLDTFTLLTTEASPSLQWLHHRQPLLIPDANIAEEWIRNPTQALKKSIVSSCSKINANLIWHPVTKLMSSVKYRNADATQPIKISKIASVKSFFDANRAVEQPIQVKLKRNIAHNNCNIISNTHLSLNKRYHDVKDKQVIAKEGNRKKLKMSGRSSSKIKNANRGSIITFFKPKGG